MSTAVRAVLLKLCLVGEVQARNESTTFVNFVQGEGNAATTL